MAIDVYDIVPLSTVTDGSDGNPPDQIRINGVDPIEVSKIIDSGNAIMVRGYSHLTGDDAVYILPPDTMVELWTA